MTAAMPRKTQTITLDDIGYPGWLVTVHTNPRVSIYNDLVGVDVSIDTGEKDDSGKPILKLDEKRWWKAFANVVIEWNFADEDGRPLPHPREFETETAVDLPVLLLSTILLRYHQAVRDAAAVPKALSEVSAPTSSTSGGDQKSD